ncbi:MAG: LysR family transcriptional regulator [Pseudomonadota bacterium]
MNLKQLEAFKATIESGSITAASQLLCVSQPSVSRLISDLERSVGFPLFLRKGRGLTATVEARRLYRAVDSVFVGIDKLSELADAIRTTAGEVVSVGVIPAFSQVLLPEAVAHLHDARQDIRFMISTRNTPAIVDAVRLQQFDLGIVGRSPPYDGVTTLYQAVFPYVVLLRIDHPDAVRDCMVDLEELAETDSFITFGGAFPDEMSGMDAKISQLLSSKSRISATNMPTASALTRESGIVSIVDPFSAKQAERLGGVVARPLQQTLSYNVAVITKGHDTLSKESRELANHLIEQFKSHSAS